MSTSELAQLMEEPAGGHNCGRATSTTPALDGRHLPLETSEWQAREFLQSGGWTIVSPETEGVLERAGMTAHRGVLHLDEYVDHERLVGLVEDELGFSFDELHSVYSTGGRLPNHLRELRERIDARLLALSRSGSNMDLLSRVTGVNPRTVDRALARARVAEGGDNA